MPKGTGAQISFLFRKMNLLWLFLTQTLFLGVWGQNDPILASMTWSEKDGFKLVENELLSENKQTVAIVNFTNAINQTGWSYLEVTTFPQFPDKVQV